MVQRVEATVQSQDRYRKREGHRPMLPAMCKNRPKDPELVALPWAPTGSVLAGAGCLSQLKTSWTNTILV